MWNLSLETDECESLPTLKGMSYRQEYVNNTSAILMRNHTDVLGVFIP